MKGIIDFVVKWWKVLATIFAIICLRIFLPIPIFTLISLFVFVYLLKSIIEGMGIQNPAVKILHFFGGVFIFLGLRIFLGNMINMPLTDSYLNLKGIGIMGLITHEIPKALLLEIMFIVPAGGVAYAFAKGGKFIKFLVWCLFCIMFFVVLWQVKQEQNSTAWQKHTQANVDGKTKKWNLEALQKGVENRTIIAVAQEDFPSFTFTKEDSTFTATGEIKCGDKMVLKDTNPKFNVGEAMIQVIPEKDNLFIGDTVWVPYSKIRILEYRTSSSDHSKQWVTVFDKTFTGKGYGQGDDGSIVIATVGKDLLFEDRITIIGEEFEVWYANAWNKHYKERQVINKYSGSSGTYDLKAPEGATFKVRIERFMYPSEKGDVAALSLNQ